MTRRLAIVAVALSCLACANAAQAAESPLKKGTVDLLTEASARIDGAAVGDGSGFSVSSAGDVNGDKIGDVLVGARLADSNGQVNSGAAYLLYGGPNFSTADLAVLTPERGFRITGAQTGDLAGVSGAGAGDVNADGYADLIVGASMADNNVRPGSGSAYVIFGGPNHANVDLANLAGGFRIDGANTGDQLGYAVSSAGDVNNDGRADLLVGAPQADPQGRSEAGSSYVIYGKAGSTTVDVNALGAQGLRFDGAAAGDQSGISVASGGGRLIIGASQASPGGRAQAGSAFVVTPAPATPVTDLGAAGHRIDGASAGDQLGHSVAPAGLFNPDGNVDFVIGAVGVDAQGRTDSGAAYVVFARQSNLNVGSATASDLVRLTGGQVGDRIGSSVAGAGDANGDGRDDVLIGADGTGHNGRSDSGSAYLIYGSGSPRDLDASALGSAGVQLDGPEAFCQTGVSVAMVDINGDGASDVAIGGSLCSPQGRTSAGITHIVYGYQPPEQLPVPPVVTPPPVISPTVPTPPPALPVAQARLRSETGCVKRSFYARVSGTNIASVRITLDGKRLKVSKMADGSYRAQVKLSSKTKRGVHRVVSTINFTPETGAAPKVIRSSFQKCVTKRIRPRQTG